jgi:uncharacterized protein
MVLHLPAVRGPAVVACHGLGSSKDSEKLVLFASECVRSGVGLARFDFRGCGESSGVEGQTTVATRIVDLRAVMARLADHPTLDGRVGLLGSSLGGFIALQVAAELAGREPVVTWNAPASLRGLAQSSPDEGSGLGVALLDELAGGRYAEAPSGVARHLIIQGEFDDVVPAAHALMLHARARAPSDLVVIEGGDHRLTAPAHRARTAAESLRWFQSFWV